MISNKLSIFDSLNVWWLLIESLQKTKANLLIMKVSFSCSHLMLATWNSHPTYCVGSKV